MGHVDEVAPADAPLIGIEDIETPPWARGYEATARSGLRTVTRSAVRTAAQVIRWAWRSSPTLTLLTGIVQLVAGAVTASGLLAAASVFTSLLAEMPTPERVVAALPSLVLVATAFAARGLLDAAVAAVQSDLVPRIEQRAQDDLYAAVIDVDLVAFDDPDFTEQLERVAQESISRIRIATRVTGDLIASLVSMTAAVVTAGLLHPVLAPLVLLAAAPQGWASIRDARARLGSWRIATRLMTEDVALGRRCTLIQLTGRTLTGVATALAYVVLGLLIYNYARRSRGDRAVERVVSLPGGHRAGY